MMMMERSATALGVGMVGCLLVCPASIAAGGYPLAALSALGAVVCAILLVGTGVIAAIEGERLVEVPEKQEKKQEEKKGKQNARIDGFLC